MEQGKTVQEMSVKELKELATTLKIENATKMKKEQLISAIKAFEEENWGALKEMIESNVATEEVKEEKWAMGYHEGKKIISIVDKEVNGILYKEITVEDNSVYLERA